MKPFQRPEKNMNIVSNAFVSTRVELEKTKLQSGWSAARNVGRWTAMFLFKAEVGVEKQKDPLVVSISENAGEKLLRNKFLGTCVVSLSVPETISVIEPECFLNCDLRSIYFPSNCRIRALPRAAFRGSRLARIDVPASVEVIDDSCFQDCRNLIFVTFAFASNLRKIGKRAFCACGVERLIMPRTVTTIDDECFGFTGGGMPFGQRKSNLKYLFFEKGSELREIGTRGLYGTAIETLVIPSTLGHLGDECFQNCLCLKSLYFSEMNELPNIGSGTFATCPASCVVLPTGLREIRDDYFSGFKSLRILEVFDCGALKRFGVRAFSDCFFEDIFIPSSVEVIDDECFSSCHRLSNVHFGPNSNLKTIRKRAFYLCNSLTEFSLPFGVEVIGGGAFLGCNIDRFTENPKFSCSNGLLVSTDCHLLGTLTELAVLCVPDCVTCLEDGSFENCLSVKRVIFANDSHVWRLGKRAFAGSMIEDVVFPPSLVVIDDECFANCKTLFSLTFPNQCNLERLGERAFYMCCFPQIDLSSTSLAVIDDECFAEHRLQLTIIFSDLGKLARIGTRAFYDCGVNEIKIPCSVETIEDECFGVEISTRSTRPRQCPLSQLSFDGDSCLSFLGKHSFSLCNIKTVVIPRTVTIISDGCFRACSQLDDLRFSEPSLLRIIGKYAFAECKLATLDLPDSVETIDDNCFSQCKSLHSVAFSVLSQLRRLGKRAFFGCKVSQFVFPVNLEIIDSECFKCCPNLSPILPETTKSLRIASDAFDDQI